MNKRTISILSLILLSLAIWLLRDNENVAQINEINRHPNKLIITKHARCRMNCRFFSESEVREILEKGKINYKKSQPNDNPCPSYALEGITSDGQEARMIFATCDNDIIKVVTCIDLGNDYDCHCN